VYGIIPVIMKTKASIILFALAFVFVVPAGFSGARAEARRETRALWAPEKDLDTPGEADALIAKMVDSNMNVLLPCVFCHGNVYFKNEFLDMPASLPEGYDPLAYLVEKGHEAGIEVHPWFCVTYIGVRGADGGGMLLRKYPEYGAKSPEGGWADADSGGGLYANVTSGAYRDFMVSLMSGMVRDYGVDGLHYDYIRAASISRDELSEKVFREKFGHGLDEATPVELGEWHTPAIDDIVSRTTARAREFDPGVLVSAAVFTNVHYIAKQGQDAFKWVNEGWIDVAFTMNYASTKEMVRFEQLNFASRLDESADGAGLSIYVIDTEGKAKSRPPKMVLDQIRAMRKMGIKQLAFFASPYLDEAITAALVKGPFAEKVPPYHRAAN